MAYTDIGFNEHLIREDLATLPPQFNSQAFEQFTSQISGSKLSGLLQSQDGRIKIDLDNNTIIVSDGVTEVVRLGKQADDSQGLVVKDKNGKTLMRVTTNENYIQSADGNSKLDFIKNNYTVSENGVMKLILGTF